MAKAGRGADQFPLRLPEGLRDRIKLKSEQSGRSMNSEIVAALEAAFPSPDQFSSDMSLSDALEDLQKRLDEVKMAHRAKDSEKAREE